MKLEEALKYFRQGKKIQRSGWALDRYLVADIAFAHDNMGLSSNDALCVDWVVIPREFYVLLDAHDSPIGISDNLTIGVCGKTIRVREIVE